MSAVAPSPNGRGPAQEDDQPVADDDHGDRAARSLRPLAEEAERDRSDPTEQARLLRRAAGGDAAAQHSLFQENLNMVLRLAHAKVNTTGAGLTEDELLQEGSLALIAAIKGFPDSNRDDFRVYAEEQVTAAIEAARAGEIQIQREKLQLVADAEAYERAEVSILRLKGRDATLDELAEKLEWSKTKTQRLALEVQQARNAHDEELLQYLDPADLSDFEDE